MTAPLSEVYFPSVVVCNINQVRESYFEEVVSMLDHNAISNVTLDVPLNGTHQQCKDMFIYSIVSNFSATKEAQCRRRLSQGSKKHRNWFDLIWRNFNLNHLWIILLIIILNRFELFWIILNQFNMFESVWIICGVFFIYNKNSLFFSFYLGLQMTPF